MTVILYPWITPSAAAGHSNPYHTLRYSTHIRSGTFSGFYTSTQSFYGNHIHSLRVIGLAFWGGKHDQNYSLRRIHWPFMPVIFWPSSSSFTILPPQYFISMMRAEYNNNIDNYLYLFYTHWKNGMWGRHVGRRVRGMQMTSSDSFRVTHSMWW